MEGFRDGNATPGEFRLAENWIRPAGSTQSDAPSMENKYGWRVVDPANNLRRWKYQHAGPATSGSLESIIIMIGVQTKELS
jgi:hypothetical protein